MQGCSDPRGWKLVRWLGARVSMGRRWQERGQCPRTGRGQLLRCIGVSGPLWCQAMGSLHPDFVSSSWDGQGRLHPRAPSTTHPASFSPPTAAVNNSSDTESIPSPRTEAAKDTGQNGPKPPPGPATDVPPPEPPTPPPEDTLAPTEPTPAPEATGPPTPPPAPASPTAPPPVVPKEEEEEAAAAAAPLAVEEQEQTSPVAQELAVAVGGTEEPAEAPPAEPIKSECKEEAAEEGPDKGKGGSEASAEAAPEGALKVEKKEGGGPGGKSTTAKGAGAPQDSDSSATCSADEVDEPEGGDKNR